MGEIDITDVDPSAVARSVRRNDEDPFILDVRNEEDYEEWRIRGSTNLPVYDELLDHNRSTSEEHLEDLPGDEEIVVVCGGGITSTRAASFLPDHGFDATSIDEGMTIGVASTKPTRSKRPTVSSRSLVLEQGPRRIRQIAFADFGAVILPDLVDIVRS